MKYVLFQLLSPFFLVNPGRKGVQKKRPKQIQVPQSFWVGCFREQIGGSFIAEIDFVLRWNVWALFSGIFFYINQFLETNIETVFLEKEQRVQSTSCWVPCQFSGVWLLRNRYWGRFHGQSGCYGGKYQRFNGICRNQIGRDVLSIQFSKKNWISMLVELRHITQTAEMPTVFSVDPSLATLWVPCFFWVGQGRSKNLACDVLDHRPNSSWRRCAPRWWYFEKITADLQGWYFPNAIWAESKLMQMCWCMFCDFPLAWFGLVFFGNPCFNVGANKNQGHVFVEIGLKTTVRKKNERREKADSSPEPPLIHADSLLMWGSISWEDPLFSPSITSNFKLSPQLKLVSLLTSIQNGFEAIGLMQKSDDENWAHV